MEVLQDIDYYSKGFGIAEGVNSYRIIVKNQVQYDFAVGLLAPLYSFLLRLSHLSVHKIVN